MTQELRVRTRKDDVGGAVSELARHADEESLSLRSEARISSGEWVRFVVQLSDATPVLEGIGRCLGCERNGGSFYALLDQLQFDERNEVVWERILLERDSQTGKGPITGLVELDAIQERAEERASPAPPPLPTRSKPPPPPAERSKPPPAPPKPSKPPSAATSARSTSASRSTPAPTSANPATRASRPPAKTSAATRASRPPMSSSSASDRATRASRPPTSSSGPTRPKPATSTTRSKPPPKKPSDELAAHADATAPDLDPTITRVVHDPEVAARRSEAAARESEAAARESEAAARLTEHLHEATREIHIDSADLPVPRELAVRAAALVPRLERALGKEPTTRAILLTAMRLGLTSLEAQTDPDTWSDPEDPP